MHRAGTYTTALHVTTPVNIVGEGPPGEIILTAQYKDVVTWEANGGSIKNVTIKCVGECDTYGIWVKKGGLTVEGCDITSQGLACIQVPPSRLQQLCTQFGAADLLSQVLQHSSELFVPRRRADRRDGLSALLVIAGLLSVLQVCLDAEALIEDCEFVHNRAAGIAVHTGGRPAISNCEIHK